DHGTDVSARPQTSSTGLRSNSALSARHFRRWDRRVEDCASRGITCSEEIDGIRREEYDGRHGNQQNAENDGRKNDASGNDRHGYRKDVPRDSNGAGAQHGDERHEADRNEKRKHEN